MSIHFIRQGITGEQRWEGDNLLSFSLEPGEKGVFFVRNFDADLNKMGRRAIDWRD